MAWSFTPDRPIYMQLQEQIKLSIVSGRHPPGGKLPAVRDLAEEAAVNPNTVQRALAGLEREELVYTQRTNGRFVTEDAAVIEKTKNELAMELVEAFLGKMATIGYCAKETAELIASAATGAANAECVMLTAEPEVPEAPEEPGEPREPGEPVCEAGEQGESGDAACEAGEKREEVDANGDS